MPKPTDVAELLSDFEAGTLETALGAIFSQVATAVDDHNRQGEVNLKFSVQKVSGGQIKIKVKSSFKEPTRKGEKTEFLETEGVFYITGEGITFFPPNQSQMFDMQGNTEQSKD